MRGRGFGGAAAWTPADLSGHLGTWGPAYRYSDAAGTVAATTTVRAWRDYTNPTGGRMLVAPTGNPCALDGSGDVSFASDGFLSFPTGTWQQVRTVVVVGDLQGSNGSYQQVLGDRASAGLVCLRTPGAGLTLFDRAAVSFKTTASTGFGGGVRPNAWTISATADSIRFHGAAQSLSPAGASHGLQASGEAGFGGYPAQFPWAGSIAAASVFSSELSKANILRVQKYLWRLLWAASPTTKWLMVGNSLVEGSANPTAGDRYVVKLAALRPECDFTNLGRAGYKTTELTPLIPDDLLGGWDARRPVGLSMLEITNDVNVGGVNAATAAADVQAYHEAAADYCLAANVACTVPRNVPEATQAAANALVLAGYASWGCTAVIDFGSQPHIGTGDSTTDPTYWVDTNHPDGPGNAIMAAAASPVLGPLQ